MMTAETTASGRPHNHDACVKDAVATALELCAQRGARLTPQRQRVLELVWGSHRAVKAYEILDELAREHSGARPPTVYRALEFLMAHGLVHRVDSLNAFIGCPQARDRHDAQFFICDGCGMVREIDEPAIEQAVSRGAKRLGFRVDRRMVEMHGRCEACQ